MKTPTSWVSNTNANNNRYPYDSGSITFDDATRTFDGVTTGESYITTAIPATWADTTNQSTGDIWLTNTAAYVTDDNYDTAGVYDTADNYDAVIAGESFITTADPATWTEV